MATALEDEYTIPEQDLSDASECHEKGGGEVIKDWMRKGKFFPAEALTFLGWNSVNECRMQNRLQIDGVFGDKAVRKSCCVLLYYHANSVVKDVVNWMHLCSDYIARNPEVARLVRFYTRNEDKFRTFDPSHLKNFDKRVGADEVVTPSSPNNIWMQQKLYDAIAGAPRIRFNKHLTHAKTGEIIEPYVYVYRGIKDMRPVGVFNRTPGGGTYNSPDCSSWTFDMNVALRFAGSRPILPAFWGKAPINGILRLKLTHRIAALNLHCLPYEDFGTRMPCFQSEPVERAHWVSKLAENSGIGGLPVALGHVSHFETEYEVLVQPLILKNVVLVQNLTFGGVPFYEAGEEPQRLDKTVHSPIKRTFIDRVTGKSPVVVQFQPQKAAFFSGQNDANRPRLSQGPLLKENKNIPMHTIGRPRSPSRQFYDVNEYRLSEN